MIFAKTSKLGTRQHWIQPAAETWSRVWRERDLKIFFAVPPNSEIGGRGGGGGLTVCWNSV